MEVRRSIASAATQPSPHAEHEVAVAVAAPPPQIDAAVPTYSNSVVRVMAQTGLAVVVVRDGMDGEPRFQYPAEKAAREYESHAVAASEESAPAEGVADDASAAPEPEKAAKPAPVKHTEIEA